MVTRRSISTWCRRRWLVRVFLGSCGPGKRKRQRKSGCVRIGVTDNDFELFGVLPCTFGPFCTWFFATCWFFQNTLPLPRRCSVAKPPGAASSLTRVAPTRRGSNGALSWHSAKAADRFRGPGQRSGSVAGGVGWTCGLSV